MAEQEKWGLSREEIEARLRQQNQEKDEQGKTIGLGGVSTKGYFL